MIKGIDYTGVAVVYFCHDGNGNFLMNKRSANCRDEQGKWDIGGGSLEFGDTIEETLIREIKEEYCTDIISYDFLGYRDVHRINNGVPTHWLALDFKVLIDKEKVKNGEPHKFDDVGWFNLNNKPADQEVHSKFPQFLRIHSEKL